MTFYGGKKTIVFRESLKFHRSFGGTVNLYKNLFLSDETVIQPFGIHCMYTV